MRVSKISNSKYAWTAAEQMPWQMLINPIKAHCQAIMQDICLIMTHFAFIIMCVQKIINIKINITIHRLGRVS